MIEFQFARRGHDDLLLDDDLVPPAGAQVTIDGKTFNVLHVEYVYSADPARPARAVVTLE